MMNAIQLFSVPVGPYPRSATQDLTSRNPSSISQMMAIYYDAAIFQSIVHAIFSL